MAASKDELLELTEAIIQTAVAHKAGSEMKVPELALACFEAFAALVRAAQVSKSEPRFVSDIDLVSMSEVVRDECGYRPSPIRMLFFDTSQAGKGDTVN
jgi:hypothetical protein